MRPDVEIVVEYHHSQQPYAWLVEMDGALGSVRDQYGYKTEATNAARNFLHEASAKGLLARMTVYNTYGELEQESTLGPGARKASERKRAGGQCVPTEQRWKLTRTERDNLPDSAFAIPEYRAFPIPDAYHATLALGALLRTYGRQWDIATDKERGDYRWEAKKVLAAVKRKFPGVYKCEQDLVDKVRDAYDI